VGTVVDERDSLLNMVRAVLPEHVDLALITDQFNASMMDEIASLTALRDAGKPVIPEVSFDDLSNGGFTHDQQQLVKKRGCVVVRRTVTEQQANDWNLRLEDYLASNSYYQELDKAVELGDVERGKHPNILDIYWSRSQLEIRQSARLHQVQQHLNRLWRVAESGKGAFDQAQTCTYADRVRIRQPDDQTHGLPAHVDSCSLESWFDSDTIWRTYKTLLNGDWQEYDAYDAIDRACTERTPHAGACGMFRTFQGWMALTPQGADCGTLQLVPSSRCVAWMFLNMIQSCETGDEPTLPVPNAPYNLDKQKHAQLIQGLCSIPDMRSGDTVWWHPDVVHAVEHSNHSNIPSSVVYLGNAPVCRRNLEYLRAQLGAFNKGVSPPDFPDTEIEASYVGRSTTTELTSLGAQQMGHTL